MDGARDAVVGEQVAHSALEHQGRPRHGVEDLTVLRGGGHEPLGDGGVDLVERRGLFVDVVAGDGFVDEVGAGVAGRAHITVGDTCDLGECVPGDVFGTGRPEADDGDSRQGHPSPKGSTLELAASQRP